MRKDKYYTTKAESLKFICCLCGKECTGFGNNPYPLEKRFEDADDLCCDECNANKVISARIEMLNKGK